MTLGMRQVFSNNLNVLLDLARAPERGYGRIQYVANGLGVSRQTAGKWFQGQVPDLERLHQLRAWLNCSFDDLLAEKGPAAKHEEEPSLFLEFLSKHLDRPLRFCAHTAEATDPSCSYVLKVDSNVMEPYVVEGDYVCYRGANEIDHDGVYVLKAGKRFLIRRIHLLADGRVRLLPENRRYEDEDLNLSDEDPASPKLFGVVIARILVGR